MNIDIIGLTKELNAAGIQVSGCNSDGKVWDPQGNEIQNRADVAAVVAAHNPSNWALIEQRSASRQIAAKGIARSIPNWATWSQQDWATWRDANVSATQINAIANLSDAKAMLNKMAVILDSLAKMEIALRDQIWPDLPE